MAGRYSEYDYFPPASSDKILGVDIGGTNIKVGVVQENKIVKRTRFPTAVHQGRERSISQVVKAVQCFAPEVTAIGIGCAGIIDSGPGVVRFSPNFKDWRDVGLVDLLTERFKKPVRLINDVNAILLGEYVSGAAKGSRNAFLFTLGTGVGGAVISEGNLIAGAHGFAGEFGHMTIRHNGGRCVCGNQGCLEHYVSARSIVQLATKMMRRQKSSLGKFSLITPRIVSEQARKGDPVACGVLMKVGTYIGIALSNIINLLDPEVVVIAGGVSHAGSCLLEPIRKAVKQRVLSAEYRRYRIVRGSLGNDAGIIGAAYYTYFTGSNYLNELDFRKKHCIISS